jgi:glycolate oxidase iron-sulfur subunit
LLLNNCVQPAMSPSIDAATARVLDVLGVQTIVARGSGCCGAIRQHLDDHEGARKNARRNIDAWWPFIESNQLEAILINASGCGAMVKEYGHLLGGDAAYADKARRVVELARDPVEVVADELMAAGVGGPRPAPDARTADAARAGADRRAAPDAAADTGATADAPRAASAPPRRVAFHPPCTLQHGLKIRGKVESLLVSLGAELVPVRDTHLCCGSAGTYSLLQPGLSGTLRSQKLEALLGDRPEIILSANIGCIAHLQTGTPTPVRHWIEWVDEALAAGVASRRPGMSQIGKKA